MCVHWSPSLHCAGLRRLASLLLLAQYHADDIMLLHVLYQLFFTGGLKAADAAAEEQHAVLHTCRKPAAFFPHRYPQRSQGRRRRRLLLLAQNDVWTVYGWIWAWFWRHNWRPYARDREIVREGIKWRCLWRF